MTARNLHLQRLLLDRGRRLCVPHRLPQRRLRRLCLRLGPRPVRALVCGGQPGRRLLHRPVLPVRCRARRRPRRAQRPRLLRNECWWQPADRQLPLQQQPRGDRAQLGQLRALLSAARRRSSATSSTPTTKPTRRRSATLLRWVTASCRPAASATSSRATASGTTTSPASASSRSPRSRRSTTSRARTSGTPRAPTPATIRAAPPPELLLWDSYDNVVTDNVVEDSRLADLAVGTLSGDPATAGNCFSGNTFTTSAPADLEALAPCEGAGEGDWSAGALDLGALIAATEDYPPSVDYEQAELPELAELENLPDAATAPATPATGMPPALDLDAIAVPDAPAE